MSSRFFRSLLLPFYMSVHMATQAVNYDNPSIRLQELKEIPGSFSIPVSNVDYRHRARIARERAHQPNTRRPLHKSFGVTSKTIRRNPTNPRNSTESSSLAPFKPQHIGQVTSKTVIPWTWQEPVTATTTVPTTTTTTAERLRTEAENTTVAMLPTIPTWIQSNPIVSSQNVVISDLLTPQSNVFNSTITLIKEFLKDKKKKLKERRGNKRKQVKSSKTLDPTLYSPNGKNIYNKEAPQLKFKFIKSDKNVRMTGVKKERVPLVMPYSLGVKKKKRPQRIKVTGIMEKPPAIPGTRTMESESIEELGARIEDEEAERQRADGENPLKYMVKDGILFKKNKTPVARISLSEMELYPSKLQDVQKKTKTVKPQTMVESSPFVSEMRNQGNPVYAKLKTKRPKPVIPLSPPSVTLGHTLISTNQLNRKIREEEDDDHTFIHSSTTLENEMGTDPISLSKNDLIQEIQAPPPYPFSHCYMNIDGFMCCNRYLESLMRRSYRKLRRAHRFHECSVQKMANRIQNDCENVFNTTFEVVVGIDDFAIRAHFAGDLMCKIQEGGRFITAYATVMPSREGASLDPLHVVTKIEMNLRDREEQQMGDSIQFPERQMDSAVQNVHIRDQFRRRNRAQDIPFHEKSREDIDNDNIITRS